ncbi:hypothetical protein CBL_03128 [Carabus blaptoides fortunei]
MQTRLAMFHFAPRGFLLELERDCSGETRKLPVLENGNWMSVSLLMLAWILNCNWWTFDYSTQISPHAVSIFLFKHMDDSTRDFELVTLELTPTYMICSEGFLVRA